LFETTTGLERYRFAGHSHAITCIAFPSDESQIATSSDDSTVVLWDATCGTRTRHQFSPSLTPTELESLWDILHSNDAPAAYRAGWTLAAFPLDSLPFLQQRIAPIAPPNPIRLTALLRDLDSADFATRAHATAALERLGELADPPLRQALQSPASSLEQKRQIQRILDQNDTLRLSPDEVRLGRAIEVLEHIGTPAALSLLSALGSGADSALLTQDASAAFHRVRNRQRLLGQKSSPLEKAR
jgi:hypothetical protein